MYLPLYYYYVYCYWKLYDLLCIALYYWNVPLGLHVHITVLFAMYYCIVLLLKIMSNVWAERFKGTSTHPRLWVINTWTCVLCIVLLGVWNTHHIVLLNWCTIVLHCHIHTVLSNVLLSNVFSKDQLAQESCQAYGNGVSQYYPTWFKSHCIEIQYGDWSKYRGGVSIYSLKCIVCSES